MEEDFLKKLIMKNADINRRISEIKYSPQEQKREYGDELSRLQNRLKLNEMMLYDLY